MSDDGSDYEVENDYEWEIHKFDNEASKRYRTHLANKFSAIQSKKEKEQEKESRIYVNMYSDEDADLGLLEGVGGYYSVITVNPETIHVRRSTVNAITFRYLLKMAKTDTKPINHLTVSELENLRINLGTSGLLLRKEFGWKDFKTFINYKYMTASDGFINRVFDAGVNDEFNSCYMEFLLSKTRFLYNGMLEDTTLDSLRALRNSATIDPFKRTDSEFLETDPSNDIYKSSFFFEVKKALAHRSMNHAYAFRYFSEIGKLQLRTEDWTAKDQEIYTTFLDNSLSISYIDVDYKYNISYISKRNTNKIKNDGWRMRTDAVLEILKQICTGLAISFSEFGKAYLRTSAIRRNINLDMTTLERFMDASGCNYFHLANDDTNTIIIQTTLGNVLAFSTPVRIFHKNFMLCKDIAFCKIDDIPLPKNNIVNMMSSYSRRMFVSGFDKIAYDNFILNYYARLSNINYDDLNGWMSKMRRLKSKILQCSSFCRNLSAIRIQNLYRKLKIMGFYKIRTLNRLIVKRISTIKENTLKIAEETLDIYIKDRSSNIIKRCFKRVLDKKATFNIRQDFLNYIKEKREALKSSLFHKIKLLKEDRIQKIRTIDHGRVINTGIAKDGKIRLSHTYNNESKWFGFNRNDSLVNLFLSTGHDVGLLEKKTVYTVDEFMQILECVSDICSCTKSRQFIKLCRSLSGTKHNNNSIEDFLEGFCWMHESITRVQFLRIVHMFCKSTSNFNFMIYVSNNLESIFRTVTEKIAEFKIM